MSLEPASQIVAGADVHRNTSDARVRVSEDDGSKDGGPARPTKGLKCHVKTCDSVLCCLKAVMKQIRNKQSEQQADVKGTDLYRMAIQEPRDEDGERNNKTQGTPYPQRAV